jgi:GT2 family glycosyltransferase
MSKTVSVILNWERPEDTLECIRSVERSTVQTEIIVVDNGSRDDSTQLIAQASSVQLLALTSNLGFAGGFNAGIEKALASGADWIFILNNDTVIDPMAIAHLIKTSWDVAVPKILRYDAADRLWAAGARWRRFPPSVVMRGFGWYGQGEQDGTMWDTECSLEYATGCALMVRRHVFERVGLFDPIYENYMEDYDWCYRVRQAGLMLGYVPMARVLHKVSHSLGEGSPRKWQYLGRNTALFYLRHRRFSLCHLMVHVAWVSMREIVKGQWRGIQWYWHGLQEGMQVAGRE